MSLLTSAVKSFVGKQAAKRMRGSVGKYIPGPIGTLAGAASLAAGAYAAWQQYRHRNYLRGKTAIVTGGSRGLGYLIARELGQRGCRVVICGRDTDALTSARRSLEDRGLTVASVPCDVSDVDDVRHLVDETRNLFGSIDVLVNNAGIIQVGPVETMEVADFEQAMDTMFWGAFHSTWEVLPEMLRRGDGHVVNITSIGGKVSVPHLMPYSTAKFAATGFSEGLRAELADTGVSVTTVVPGLMRTGSFKEAKFKGQRQKEYAWFSTSSSLPGITMDAESAAERVVDATVRGEAERILSLPAKLLNAIHGLVPGTVANLLGFADRFILPKPDPAETAKREGRAIEREMGDTEQEWLERATTLGQRAAEQFQA